MIEDKTINSLEFNKIKDKIAALASNDITMARCLEIAPEADLELVRNNMQQVSDACFLMTQKQFPYARGLKDIAGSLKRAEVYANLNMTELLDVARVCGISKALVSFYRDDKREPMSLDSYFNALLPATALETAIKDAIISDTEIADNASPTLSAIRRKMHSTNDKIKSELNKLLHSSSHKTHFQEAIVTIRNGRYVIPVKAEYRSEIGGIVHDMSASGATVFIEPSVAVEANNVLRELENKEKAEIDRILSELTAMVSQFNDNIKSDYLIIKEIDFIFTLAQYSTNIRGIMPKINNEGIICIKKGRHPLLNPATVVPITIEMGENIRTLVITGPNTGGKTVTIKTVGLFSIMAASGILVPVSEGSNIPIFNKIYADIGDEQSIEQSLSTFSAHMTNIVHILNNIDNSTLVLYDELGAGTDPIEGAALAVSILEYSKSMGAITFATTHYSELKLYALTNNEVENAGCEFDVNSLKPTYKLLVGIPGKSNAFAISKRLGLSDNIINKAEQLLTDENVNFEDVLQSLEKSRQQAESERELAERYRLEIEKLKEQLLTDKDRLSSQKERILMDAKQEAKLIVQRAKVEVSALIDEIRAAQKEKDSISANKAINKAKEKIKEMDAPVIKKNIDNSPPPKTLLPGATVKLVDIDQVGTVLSKPDSNGNAVIQVGILKITSNISNIRLVQDVKQKTPTDYVRSKKGGGLSDRTAKMELDLRGYTLEEAILLSERFIDDALMSALHTITIIHGKGTGVLRAGIHKMLKSHPSVSEYRLGTFGEGEAGVTIVTLK
ncbi:MAG: endonuclease MutS2 [Eubacteriales bacterium]|nr:endonuclease MutS2 [Eubacteriales bacterium]